jgi:hypothetical protein
MSKIVDVARSYIGQREKPQNSGFVDPVFEQDMVDRGFEPGFAWCSLFAELCATKAYPEIKADISKLFSASAVKTFTNFSDSKKYLISKAPVLGSIVVFQRYKDGVKSWQGHIGIVCQVIDSKNFKAIEGNTNSAGSREGEVVAEKTRDTNFRETGLNILGFIILK